MSLLSRIWPFSGKHPNLEASGKLGNSPLVTGRFVTRASRDAGSFRDPIASWRGPVAQSAAQAAQERKVSQRRSADLAANDWAAASALSAIIYNTIGSGLLPDAAIPAKELGITREEARELGSRFEWIFSRWARKADITGQLNFSDLQALGLRSILSQGEMLHLAVARKDNSPFSLALQALSPSRLYTPIQLQTNPYIRDGIRFSADGRPLSYWIANPLPTPGDSYANTDNLTLSDFSEIPFSKNGRRLVFHIFRHEEEEQTRGFSAFSPSIALFRNLSDALNNELLSQVLTTSLSVFIETDDNGMAPQMGQQQEDGEGREYQQFDANRVYYGSKNQKPHIMESNRPSANFANFVERIIRSMAGSLGIPYETLAKDYSKTNYSSMRAALNEAWKLYNFLRKWFVDNYCQPIWEMVLEEAILTGMVKLPKNAPDFYTARDLWCNAEWYGPAKGFVDPVKETQATILALKAGLISYSEALSERGHDVDEMLQKLAEEKESLEPLGLWFGGNGEKLQPEKESETPEGNEDEN